MSATAAHCDPDGNQFVWASLQHPTGNGHSLKYSYLRDEGRVDGALGLDDLAPASGPARLTSRSR